MTTWIVTLDGAGARLIARRDKGFVLVEELAHPEGRLHERELTSDRSGQSFSSHGHGRHAMAKEVSPRAHELGLFLKTLADRLDRGRQSNEYTELVLAAEPHLLGLLRESLDKNTARMVSESLSTNLQPVPLHDLGSHLQRHVPSR